MLELLISEVTALLNVCCSCQVTGGDFDLALMNSEDLCLADTKFVRHTLESRDNILNVVTEVNDRLFEGLESYEHLSLDLDSLLIVILVPDWLVCVEFVHLLVEVSAGKDLTINARVVCRSVSG